VAPVKMKERAFLRGFYRCISGEVIKKIRLFGGRDSWGALAPGAKSGATKFGGESHIAWEN